MILYLDIETAPRAKAFEELDPWGRKLFESKIGKDANLFARLENGDASLGELWDEQASFHAEFNKVICVSVGYVVGKSGDMFAGAKLTSFYGHDEKKILLDLAPVIGKASALCAHFGKGFDFPILGRKYIIHGLPVPSLLDMAGVPPWKNPNIDTKELWGFGDLRGSASLDALAYAFGFPSPKSELSGDKVREVYYNEGEEGLKKIVKYCEMDVKTLINVHRRIIGQAPVDAMAERVVNEIESKKA